MTQGPGGSGPEHRDDQGWPYRPAGDPRSGQGGPGPAEQPPQQPPQQPPWRPAPDQPRFPAAPEWGRPPGGEQPRDPYGGGHPTQPLPYQPSPYDRPHGQGFGPPPGQGPPPGYGPPPPGGGRGGSKMPLVIVLIVVGVVVLGSLTAGGIAYVNSSDDPSPSPSPTPTQSTSIWSPTAQPSPTESTSTAPTKDPGRLDKRSSDGKPLSVSEMFPRHYHGRTGYSYTRYKTFATTHCSSYRYVSGAKLRNALTRGRCNQLLVATYVDRKHNVQTNAGVANLVDVAHSKAASRVASAKGPFFRTLPGPARWHVAYAFDESHGHYMLYQVVAAAKGTTNPKTFGSKAFIGFSDMQSLLERPIDKR